MTTIYINFVGAAPRRDDDIYPGRQSRQDAAPTPLRNGSQIIVIRPKNEIQITKHNIGILPQADFINAFANKVTKVFHHRGHREHRDK